MFLLEVIIHRKANQGKSDLTFEAWKSGKNKAYKQLINDERVKQRKLLEDAKNLEREKAAHLV